MYRGKANESIIATVMLGDVAYNSAAYRKSIPAAARGVALNFRTATLDRAYMVSCASVARVIGSVIPWTREEDADDTIQEGILLF